MFVVESYAVAVVMCVITMLCWGSWANTQKLASKEWRFQLFYWDYSIGVLLLTIIFALTLGSMGSAGRTFLADLGQASGTAIGLAFLGGVVFNLANILLVAAIDIAGMSVAFPIGIGLALVEGVIVNHIRDPKGDPRFLFAGVAGVVIAIIIDAIAYGKLPREGQKTLGKGIALSVVCGLLMGLFFYLVAAAMPPIAEINEPAQAGKLTPYSALFFFSLGLFLSNFLFNTLVMAKPFVGEPVPLGDYFKKGNPRLHIVGILGGIIWSIGMSFAIIAGDRAGYAISYGLGQGATMIAAFWGVFIWREFKTAPKGTNGLLALMFVFFIAGLSLIVYANA
ncbi:MAG TPA: GRP family sugar transporter [Phycisphaerae bacterium]|nr:GRP family sugar transporter [Phycisphaerae bacterium]HRR85791.1 GRP family sugar transporter [Phycisphaerae bacterium]